MRAYPACNPAQPAERLARLWALVMSIFVLGCWADKPVQSFVTTDDSFLSLSFAHQHPWALTGNLFLGGALFEVNQQEPIFIWNHLADQTSDILSSSISLNDRFALTAEPYSWVHWSLTSGEATGYWHSSSRIHEVALDGSGMFAALALNDATINYVDVRAGLLLHRFRHQGPVRSVAIDAQGLWMISGSEDQTARLWRLDTAQEQWRMEHRNQVRHVNLSPSGNLALSYANGDGLQIWLTEEQLQLWHFRNRHGHLSSSHFIDDQRLLVGTRTGQVLLYDLSQGQIKDRWRIPSSTFARHRSQAILAVGALGDQLWAASSDGRMHYLGSL